jgi:uracil DNA glycosylase
MNSVWRDRDSRRTIEASDSAHSIFRTKGSCRPSQGCHRGCGYDDVTDQVIISISNQCIHSVWGDADSNRKIKFCNVAHSICRTRRSCNSSQGCHRGCGDDDVTDQVIISISNQCIHFVWGDADSNRIIEFGNSAHSICRTRGSCHSSQGRH